MLLDKHLALWKLQSQYSLSDEQIVAWFKTLCIFRSLKCLLNHSLISENLPTAVMPNLVVLQIAEPPYLVPKEPVGGPALSAALSASAPSERASQSSNPWPNTESKTKPSAPSPEMQGQTPAPQDLAASPQAHPPATQQKFIIGRRSLQWVMQWAWPCLGTTFCSIANPLRKPCIRLCNTAG